MSVPVKERETYLGLCGRTLHLEKAEKNEKKGKIEKEKKKRE